MGIPIIGDLFKSYDPLDDLFSAQVKRQQAAHGYMVYVQNFIALVLIVVVAAVLFKLVMAFCPKSTYERHVDSMNRSVGGYY